MRGTLTVMMVSFFFPGIIPAYAGNTSLRMSVAHAIWDHPRVCGEHHHGITVRGAEPGIIPAYAGNTIPSQPFAATIGDHPRVCGEHATNCFIASMSAGSSPRMRGTQ